MVTITTHDGKIHTDPSQVKVARNTNTEKLYRFLEKYIEGKARKTA